MMIPRKKRGCGCSSSTTSIPLSISPSIPKQTDTPYLPSAQYGRIDIYRSRQKNPQDPVRSILSLAKKGSENDDNNEHCNVITSPYFIPTLFPVIHTMDQLVNSCWYRYIDKVYGVDTIDQHFPIDISSFNYFYYDDLPPNVKQVIDPYITRKPCILGDLYRSIDTPYDGCNVIWSYIYPFANLPPNVDADGVILPTPPFQYDQGFPSHTWVEVNHCEVEFDNLYLNGYWFYFTKGSGVWYNLGKTIVFDNHINAYCYFKGIDVRTLTKYQADCLEGGVFFYNSLDNKNYELGRAAGYDSIQYLYRYEYDENLRGQYKYEIQDLRYELPREDLNKNICPDEKLAPYIRGGWWKSELVGQPPLTCPCDPQYSCLYCPHQTVSKCPLPK